VGSFGASIKQIDTQVTVEDRQKNIAEVFTPQVLSTYEKKGFVSIGKIIDDNHITILRNRLDQIMLGEADAPYENMMMQLDSPNGIYEDAGVQTLGWKKRTLNYRKILYIENDKVFGEFIFQKLFADICQTFHPQEKPFTYYRTMVMNKPANGGTDLPWHQDKWNINEREPSFTIYIPLDAATKENGCVQAFQGSHELGLLGDTKGFFSEERIAELFGNISPVPWELEAGEAVIMNRLCIHSSGRNLTSTPRRAISILF
jgi:ectoine hydroxylase-related dioxygenase (phytanoyl-CoA dioxygenase family)